MTGNDALALLREATQSIDPSLTMHVQVERDRTGPVGAGKADISNTSSELMTFQIGTLELEENRDAECSDVDVAAAVVALFHEVCGHGGQCRYEFGRRTVLGRILALNYYGCKASKSYYGTLYEQI